MSSHPSPSLGVESEVEKSVDWSRIISTIRSSLEAAGVKLRNEGRFQQALRRLEDFVARGRAQRGSPSTRVEIDPQDVFLSCEVMRAAFIADALGGDAAMLTRLVWAMDRDAVLPKGHPKIRGRDLFSELYVFARLTAAGARPTWTEPDMAFQYEGQAFGAAVKRQKSGKTLFSDIEDGIRQLARQRLPGAVILDTSPLVADHNASVAGQPSADLTALKDKFESAVFEPAVRRFVLPKRKHDDAQLYGALIQTASWSKASRQVVVQEWVACRVLDGPAAPDNEAMHGLEGLLQRWTS